MRGEGNNKDRGVGRCGQACLGEQGWHAHPFPLLSNRVYTGAVIHMEGDKIGISDIIKGGMSEIIGEEEMITAVARDMVKDEMKAMVRETLEKNPELKEELRAAIKMYFEARVKEVYATVLIAKCMGKVGMEAIPDDLKDEISKDLVVIFEKEISSIIEKALQ